MVMFLDMYRSRESKWNGKIREVGQGFVRPPDRHHLDVAPGDMVLWGTWWYWVNVGLDDLGGFFHP